MRANEITHAIIGAAIEVHRELGPGKPEAAYEQALARELTLRGLAIRVQKPVPVVYKGVKLECGFRLDVLVCDTVVVEVKSAEVVIPVHRAQTLTYLKLGGWKLALLLNFNVAVLKEGIERLVLGLEEEGENVAAMHSPSRVIARDNSTGRHPFIPRRTVGIKKLNDWPSRSSLVQLRSTANWGLACWPRLTRHACAMNCTCGTWPSNANTLWR